MHRPFGFIVLLPHTFHVAIVTASKTERSIPLLERAAHQPVRFVIQAGQNRLWSQIVLAGLEGQFTSRYVLVVVDFEFRPDQLGSLPQRIGFNEDPLCLVGQYFEGRLQLQKGREQRFNPKEVRTAVEFSQQRRAL